MESVIPASLDARLAWRLQQLQRQRTAAVTELATLDRSIAELEALIDPSRYRVPETFDGQPEEHPAHENA